MQGFGVFLGKEIKEFFSTWRGRIIFIIIVLFAVLSPVMAYLTPTLLGSVAGDLGLKIPDPTFLDSYAQWDKNISQLVCIAVVIATSGIISAEIQNGTAALMLSKPLSRPAFVLSKFLVQTLFIILITIVGAGFCELFTRILFHDGDIMLLAKVTGVWIVLLVVIVAIMMLLSARFSSLPAAGIGVALFFALSIATMSKILKLYSPAGLFSITTDLMAKGHPDVLWPLVTSGLAVVVFLGVSVLIFNRREI